MPVFSLILAGWARHDPVSHNIDDAAFGRDGGTVDATDLKSVGAMLRAGSNPAPGTGLSLPPSL